MSTFKNHNTLTAGDRVIPANKTWPPKSHGYVLSINDPDTKFTKYEIYWLESGTLGFYFGFEVRKDTTTDADYKR